MNYSRLDEFHKITQLKEINLGSRVFKSALPGAIQQQLPSFDYLIHIGDQVFSANNIIKKDIEINLVPKINAETTTVKETPGNILASIHVYFSFQIRGLPSYITFSEKSMEYEIDSDLTMWLNHIVIATSRGIMYSEFKGTPFQINILPLINPEDLRDSELKT